MINYYNVIHLYRDVLLYLILIEYNIGISFYLKIM